MTNGAQHPSNRPESGPVYSATPPAAGAPFPYPQNYPSHRVAPSDPRHKSPLVASVLSAVPGLGQIYVGYYPQGFINALVVAGIITLLAMDSASDLLPLLALFMAFFWLYNIIDAGRRASFYNQALAGDTPPELPDSMKMPGVGGSIFGGALLVIVGLILLLHNVADLPVEWIEDWWPVVPIAFGAYLIVRAMQDKAARRAAGPLRD